ncbi:MAG TPA: hypothetical protein VJX16_28855, partial [Terriglobales bacterium]|nr:hypothetical protein [Terriglobales bacterium]
MVGYSLTPLPKKLGIKERTRIALPGIPPDAIARCEMAEQEPPDFVLLFVKTQADLKKSFPPWSKRLEPAGMLWVA